MLYSSLYQPSNGELFQGRALLVGDLVTSTRRCSEPPTSLNFFVTITAAGKKEEVRLDIRSCS